MEYRTAKSLISTTVMYVFGNFPLSLHFDLASYNLYTKIRITSFLCRLQYSIFRYSLLQSGRRCGCYYALRLFCVLCQTHTLTVLLIINLPSHRSASSSSFPEILCPWTQTTFVALICSRMTTSLCCHRKLSFHTVDEKCILNLKI